LERNLCFADAADIISNTDKGNDTVLHVGGFKNDRLLIFMEFE